MLEQDPLVSMSDPQKKYRALSEEVVELGWSYGESSRAPLVFGKDLTLHY